MRSLLLTPTGSRYGGVLTVALSWILSRSLLLFWQY